jgi:dissimilatory sulfite reductase (desulfoviridin) alpha/beta subunit
MKLIQSCKTHGSISLDTKKVETLTNMCSNPQCGNCIRIYDAMRHYVAGIDPAVGGDSAGVTIFKTEGDAIEVIGYPKNKMNLEKFKNDLLKFFKSKTEDEEH